MHYDLLYKRKTRVDSITYNVIKNKIRRSIVLNNGYQFDDLCHDTVEKLLIQKKSNTECKKLCVIVALNLIRDHHRKYSKLKTEKLYEIEYQPVECEKIGIVKPVRYKEMFVLRYKLSMRYKEIADYLNIPIGTVKVDIHRMHRELRSLNV